MENVVPIRIQIITIVVSISFLIYIGRLILKGKLREEYSIVWLISTLLIIIFAFWRNGLDVIANALGVFVAPNLIFAAALFAVFSYLLHLSVVVSKLQEKNKILAQDLALMKELFEEMKEKDNTSKK